MPSAKLGEYLVTFGNSEEYHHLKQEIFTHHSYYVELNNPSPLIIDLGAHIGLATLYFKHLYPAAKVVAVEPLPANLKFLHQNIANNHLDNVTVIPKAITTQDGEVEFFFDASGQEWWSTAGFTKGSWTKTQTSESVMVEATTLKDILAPHFEVDILKVDIEGAEFTAFATTPATMLRRVKHCFVEYHPAKDRPLEILLENLKKGFTNVDVISTEKSGLALIEASNHH